jgi:5'-nucleotidase
MSEPRFGDWILTHSGVQFWPIDPRPEDVRIEDVAHALSLQCRFSGHCRYHYSVAQHSVLVSLHVPEEDALWGLLHDAAEAYLVDLPRPIKRYSEMGRLYKELETALEVCIAEKFRLPLPVPPSVKIEDDRALMTEKRDIMPGSEKPWKETACPYPETIVRMQPITAEVLFLDRFRALELAEARKNAKAVEERK